MPAHLLYMLISIASFWETYSTGSDGQLVMDQTMGKQIELVFIRISFELKCSTCKSLNGAVIYAQIPVAMDRMVDELLSRSFWLLLC